jgi:hypothetical protein
MNGCNVRHGLFVCCAFFLFFHRSDVCALADDAAKNSIEQPVFAVGDVLLSQTDLRLEDGKLTATMNNESISVPCSMEIRYVDLVEVTKTKDRKVAETLVDVLCSYSTVQFRVKEGEQEVTHTEFNPDPTQGRKLLFASRAGNWHGSVSDGTTPDQLKPFLEHYHPPDEDSFLPAKPAKVRDKWSVDELAMKRFVPDAIRSDGKADCQFEAVVDHRGKPHALVRWRLETDAVVLDGGQNELKFRLGVNGQSWYELGTNVESDANGKGSMVVEGDFAGFKAKVSGRVNVTFTQQRLSRVR